jgi:hypothetical protein
MTSSHRGVVTGTAEKLAGSQAEAEAEVEAEAEAEVEADDDDIMVSYSS